MTATIDLASFLALTQGDNLAGGAVQVQHEQTFIFVHRLPLAARKLEAVGEEMAAAIEQNWQSSGRKETRSYTLSIVDGARNIAAQRVVAKDAEPVQPEDIQLQSMRVTLTVLKEAAETVTAPFKQQKKLFKRQGSLVTTLEEQLKTAQARIALLEGEAQKSKDDLRHHQGQFAEAGKHEAEARASLVLANAQARAWDKMSDTVAAELPQLTGLAARMMGGKKLGALADAFIGNSNGQGAPAQGKSTPGMKAATEAMKVQAFPAALAAEVRKIGLTDLELTRVLFFVLSLDPGMEIVELLDAATFDKIRAVAPLAHAHWKG